MQSLQPQISSKGTIRQHHIWSLFLTLYKNLTTFRYDTLFLRRTLEQELPNFRWCLGPSCTFGQEHPDDPSPKPLIVCSFCGFVACSNHNSPWHSGRTCEEYDKETRAGMSSVEKHSEKIIRKIAKRCPGCERYINKNGGCGHMTCKYSLLKPRCIELSDLSLRSLRQTILLELLA